MKTYNKETKLKWVDAALSMIYGRNLHNEGFFSCVLMETAAGYTAGYWYASVLKIFMRRRRKVAFDECPFIEMFHDAPNQKYFAVQNIENRVMWMFMLKTLIEVGEI